jgi:hypothetical protein
MDGKSEHSKSTKFYPSLIKEKPLRSLSSHHSIDNESSFEHFICVKCSAPKHEAKLTANALFHQISHYKIIDQT